MSDARDEIKSRLSIEDLVSQYVQLKKIGQNLKGLCPFHAEKTPSFVVSPQKGIAYCFGCHKGGDVFQFIREVEGVDFVDALKILAERTGVELKKYALQSPIDKDEKEQLLRVHETVAAFYEWQLWNSENGAKVLEYLRRRGLNDETIKLFRLGFSPDDYEATFKMLLKEGFSRKLLVASGLALSRETTLDSIHDRFRGRLMFPITDSLGRIVAFGGRALAHEQDPKYLNSPETAIYHKSNILYGFSWTKASIKTQKSAVLVEGYMDMIAAYQAGITNVAAVSGTALTSQQLRLLKPFSAQLCLAFDMDLAGQEAAKRAFELAQEFDFEVKILELPEGKDIAEFCQHSPADLSLIIQKAERYGDYLYKRLISIHGADDFSARPSKSEANTALRQEDASLKLKILQDFSPFLHTLKSPLAKDEYVRILARDFRVTEKQLYDELKNFKLPVTHPARLHVGLSESNEPSAAKSKKFQAEELLIAFILEYPRIGLLLKDKISSDYFAGDMKDIYKQFSDQYNGLGVWDVDLLRASLPYELAQKITLVSLYISEFYGEIGEEAVEREMKLLLDKLIKNTLNKKRLTLQHQIGDTEKQGKKDESRRFIRELDALSK